MVLAEAGPPRGQEPNPAQRAHPEASRTSRDSGAPRPLARLGKARPLACPGVGRAVRCRNARTPLLVSELVDPAECATRETEAGGSRRPQRLGDVDRGGLNADERDDARRLAQRCTPQPHSFALLHNSVLRMRLSLSRFITSLALSCASNMPGRGREVQAEWPRTLDADRASLKALL